MLCGLLSFLAFRANDMPGPSHGRWDYLSREFLCMRRSKAAYAGRYALDAKFPVMPGCLGVLSDPRQRLDNLLRASLLENGVSSLPLYPGDQAPRAEYDTHPKKQATKKKGSKRQKSKLEMMSGKWRRNTGLRDGKEDIGDIEDKDGEYFEEEPLPEKPQRELYPGEEALYLQTAPAKKMEKKAYTCKRCGGDGHTRPKCESCDISYLLKSHRCYPGQIETLQQGMPWLKQYTHLQQVVIGDLECECVDCCDGFGHETSLRYGKLIARAAAQAGGLEDFDCSSSSISFESEFGPLPDQPHPDGCDSDEERLALNSEYDVNSIPTPPHAGNAGAAVQPLQSGTTSAPSVYHSFNNGQVGLGPPPLPPRRLAVVYTLSETARNFVFIDVKSGTCKGRDDALARLNLHLGGKGEAAAKAAHLKNYLDTIAEYDRSDKRYVLLLSATQDAASSGSEASLRAKAKPTASSGHVLQEQFSLEHLSADVTGWLEAKLRADERLSMRDLVAGAQDVARDCGQGLPTDKVVEKYVKRSGARWHAKGTQYVLADEFASFSSTAPRLDTRSQTTAVVSSSKQAPAAARIGNGGKKKKPNDEDANSEGYFGGFAAPSKRQKSLPSDEDVQLALGISQSLEIAEIQKEVAAHQTRNPEPKYTEDEIHALRSQMNPVLAPVDLEAAQVVISESNDAKDFRISLARIQGTYDQGWLNDSGIMLVLSKFWGSLPVDSARSYDLQLLSALLYRFHVGQHQGLKQKDARRLEEKLGQILMKKVNAAHLFVPLNLHGNHWALAVVSVKQQKIFVFDSLCPSGNNRMSDGGWEKFVGLCNSVWNCVFETNVRPCLQQNDGSSCGIHTVVNALLFAVGINPKGRNSPLKGSDMKSIRASIVADLTKEDGCTFEWMGTEWQKEWTKLKDSYIVEQHERSHQ
jgi:hypothetical protein